MISPHPLKTKLSLVLVSLIGCTLPTYAEETLRGLPPIECVETLRQARIDASLGKATESMGRLEDAIDLPGCDLPALAELLRGLEGAEVSPARVESYRTRLLSLIVDPGTRLPPGMISYIAWSTPAAERRRLVESLESRRATSTGTATTTPGGERRELLDVLTSLYDLLGEPEQARATLSRLLEMSPTAANRWRALLLDERLERWESLLGLLEPMLQTGSSSDYLLRLHVLSLAQLGRYDELLVALEPLTPRLPSSESTSAATLRGPTADRFAALLVRVAWALRDARLDAEAETMFRRARALVPEAPESQRAELALLHLYSSPEERRLHQTALDQRRREETDPMTLYEEASRLLASGNAESAREMLARAAPELGDTAFAEAAWYNLGIAAFRLEAWNEAALAFERALALEPSRAEAHHQRGIALYQLGQCEEAIPALLESLELQPEKYQAHYYLAACYESRGDHDAADRSRRLYQTGAS